MECRPNLYSNAYPTVTMKITSKTPQSGMYCVHPKHVSLWSEIWDKHNNPKSNLDHTHVPQGDLASPTQPRSTLFSSNQASTPVPVQATLQPGTSVSIPAAAQSRHISLNEPHSQSKRFFGQDCQTTH